MNLFFFQILSNFQGNSMGPKMGSWIWTLDGSVVKWKVPSWKWRLALQIQDVRKMFQKYQKVQTLFLDP